MLVEKFLAENKNAKILHFVRHGESLHKQWQSAFKGTKEATQNKKDKKQQKNTKKSRSNNQPKKKNANKKKNKQKKANPKRHFLKKILAAQNPLAVDKCYDLTLPDKKDATKLLADKGELNCCPFVAPCCFDPPLTAHARESSAALAKNVELASVDAIYAAADTRALETARFLPRKQNLQENRRNFVSNEIIFVSGPKLAKIIAVEELRAMISPHLHSKRSSRSALHALFPSADFSRIPFEDDELWEKCCVRKENSESPPMQSLTDPFVSRMSKFHNTNPENLLSGDSQNFSKIFLQARRKTSLSSHILPPFG